MKHRVTLYTLQSSITPDIYRHFFGILTREIFN